MRAMNTKPQLKTTAAYSIDKRIAKRVADMAKSENRSKSNMAEVLLDLALRQYEQQRQDRAAQ